MFQRQLETTDKGSVHRTGNMLVFILVSPFFFLGGEGLNHHVQCWALDFNRDVFKIHSYFKIFFHILISLNWVGLTMNSIFWWKTVVAITDTNSIKWRAELFTAWGAGTQCSLREEAELGPWKPRRGWEPSPFSPFPDLLLSDVLCSLVLCCLAIRVLERSFCILEKTDLNHAWSQYQIPGWEFHCSAWVQLRTVKITGSCQTSLASRGWLPCVQPNTPAGINYKHIPEKWKDVNRYENQIRNRTTELNGHLEPGRRRERPKRQRRMVFHYLNLSQRREYKYQQKEVKITTGRFLTQHNNHPRAMFY